MNNPAILVLEKISKNRSKLQLFFTSGINQVLSSGTNFLLNLYLVNELSPGNFGTYGIGFAIILFLGGIGNALFLTQMIVIFPKIEKYSQENFLRDVLNLLILFSGLLIAVGFSSNLLLPYFPGNFYHNGFLISGLIFASIGYILKDFYVRVAYNNRKEKVAIHIHLSLLAVTLLSFGAVRYLMNELTVAMAFFVFGVAHMAAVIVGSISLKIFPRNSSWNILKETFRKLWNNGKWASISNIVFSLRAQAHTIIATILIGSVGVGKLNAARLFIAPVIMIIPVISQLAMPRLAALRETNKSSLLAKSKNLTAFFLGFGILYSSVLLLVYDKIISTFFNDNYGNLFFLTFLWCLYGMCVSTRNAQDIVAQVLEKFRRLTTFNVWSAIITLATSFFMAELYGLEGIVYGLIIGEIVLFIMLNTLLKR